MKTLLCLQELDLNVERCKARAQEIPKQKSKLEVQKKRLAEELEEREQARQHLKVEQRESESETDQHQAQIGKYQQQLLSVKKNEEYQALLHEIETLKKQVALKEERIITIMVELDDTNARLQEDKKRIEAELKAINRQCGEADEDLAVALRECRKLEEERIPLVEEVDRELITRYNRIRGKLKAGAAVVPLIGEVCSGCHMYVPPQIVNEVLAGEKVHVCIHCGRILYHEGNVEGQGAGSQPGIS